MSRRKRLTNYVKRVLRALQGVSDPKPTTFVSGGGTTGQGNKPSYFKERARDKDQLEKYYTIYEQGGIITEAINAYAYYTLSNGWRLEGDDEELKATIQDWLDYIDFDGIMWQGIVEALVIGDAIQENANNVSSEFVSIIPRRSSQFTIKYDDYGNIIGYEQRLTIDGVERVTELKKEQITHLQLFPKAGSVYGHSLIHQSFDDIMRDTKVAEATAVAIERHGFRKYQVKVGLEDEDIPQTVFEKIDEDFQELESKNDFVTNRNVDVIGLDDTTLEGVNTYSDWSLSRLCASLGVPEELLGLRRGTTDATAVSRVNNFYKKIGTIQKKVARCYNINVIDRLSGAPGAVKLVFNDVSPDDEKEKASWIAQIMQATPIDPFAVLPKKWIQEQFDIEEEYMNEDIAGAGVGASAGVGIGMKEKEKDIPGLFGASINPTDATKARNKAEQAKIEAEQAYIAHKSRLLEQIAGKWS
jgi:hypothetical protein